MASTVAFIICTEPPFERQSVLLVRSIRRFAGSLSTAPIYSFSPRGCEALSSLATTEFSRLAVEHSDTILNPNYTSYGVYNKPFVCAYAERHIDADVLMFLDSDKVIFNEPCALVITTDYIAAAQPVGEVNIGVNTLHGGQNQEYWRELYRLCGVKTPSVVRTSVTGCEILAYYNSGMISARPQDRVWSRWADNFVRVVGTGLQPSDPFFTEQSVFSATLSSMDKPVAVLPSSYNYHLPAHHVLSNGKRVRRFEELVSIHYHCVFERGNWLPFLTRLPLFERDSLRYHWLVENLIELNEKSDGGAAVAGVRPGP
jgi:hypothetical protein